MLESIRKHSKFVMILLFLLIIPSFVLVGIDQSYFSGSSPVVAQVDGQEITQADWDNRHRVESDRLRAENPTIDTKFLDSQEAKFATLDRMVQERVMQAAIEKMHLVTSDAALVRALHSMPAIASFRNNDGSLNAEGYRQWLASQGYTPESFEAVMRRELSLRQVLGNVASTIFPTAAVADLAMDAFLQRREIQVAQFLPKNFEDKVQVSPEDLKSYYQAHRDQFQQPELADVEYVVLDLQTVRDAIELNEADVKSYYQENSARLAEGKEERRASHILINAQRDASSEDKEKAKAKAQQILEELKQDPVLFAEIAKTQSDDTASAKNGGDLGYLALGDTVPQLDQAIFALNKGDLSEVVETEFGYHIVQVTDVKKPEVPAYADVREKIINDLKDQQAQRKFAEVAELFANTVYENAESLQPAVDQLNLKLQTAKGVARTPAPSAEGVLANAEFLDALFTSDNIENKRNTEAIDLGSSQMAAGRIVSYQPARQLSFDEVSDQVQSQYVLMQSVQLAHQAGQQALSEWKENPTKASGLLPAVVVSREDTMGMPAAVLNAALEAKTDALPAWSGVDLGEAGYAIVKIEKIVPATQRDENFEKQVLQQYAQLDGAAEAEAYYAMLKKKFNVKIKVTRL